jgi:hypothetical protein
VTACPPSTVGIDFDNTLISYEAVMARLAAERGLLPSGAIATKKQIRDAIRMLPDGEKAWMRLQADVYGPGISEGRIMDGAKDFFQECRRRSVRVYVVSHKTQFAAGGDGKTDLRTCALDWMRSQGFFDTLGLPRENVYFEATREEKVRRIGRTGCSLFVDDLEETFLEPEFPGGIRKILFGARRWPEGPPDVECSATWDEITSTVFSGRSARKLF